MDLYRRMFFVGVIPLIGDDSTVHALIGGFLALFSTVTRLAELNCVGLI